MIQLGKTPEILVAFILFGSPAVSFAQEAKPNSVEVEDLRGRIRDMRMSLLLGGEKVREAEAEAVDFYGNRIELIDRRRDSVQADLTEKRATYDVSLDRALKADDASGREAAMRKAQGLSSEINVLEREFGDLETKRRNLSHLVSAVERRGQQREELSLRIQTSTDVEAEFGMSLGGVGLAPEVAVQPTGSPLDDGQLVEDLLERDPRGARRLLFEADARGYFERFPLRPPAGVLSRALVFPMPDLPGSR